MYNNNLQKAKNEANRNVCQWSFLSLPFVYFCQWTNWPCLATLSQVSGGGLSLEFSSKPVSNFKILATRRTEQCILTDKAYL